MHRPLPDVALYLFGRAAGRMAWDLRKPIPATSEVTDVV